MAPVDRIDHDGIERMHCSNLQHKRKKKKEDIANPQPQNSSRTSYKTSIVSWSKSQHTTQWASQAKKSYPKKCTPPYKKGPPLPPSKANPTKKKKTSKSLSTSLQNVHVAASPPHLLPSVPPELLEYVENGRNPDIYTREFVELVRRGNQLMRGKQSAFASFRDILAEQMSSAMPELREDVAKVLEATGGNPAIATGGAAAAGQSGSGTSNLPARPASTVQGGQTGGQ